MKGSKELIQRLFHLAGFELSRYPKKQTINKRDRHFIKLLQTFSIDLIIDVGAASGGYAKWVFSSGYLNDIIAFEPLPDQYALLTDLAKTNPRLKVAERGALGNQEGLLEMNISKNLDSSSVLTMLPTHTAAAPHSVIVSKITVPVRKLDSFKTEFISSYSSIFLKLDVQGYEKSVLEGALHLIPFVKGIQAELSLVGLYKDQPLYEEMLVYMKSLGFELYYVRPGFADPSGRLLQFDGIFFRA